MQSKNKPIQVYRGDYIESNHDINIAVVNVTGELLGYYGDSYRNTFARSSMKPFQAVPAAESGALEEYKISQKELALFCASHNGEDFHRQAVKSVLEKIDLEEKHLQCGTHIPKDFESYKQLIHKGEELTPFYSNCSGKHAGMLSGVVKQHFDTSNYREVTHPYQQQIIDVISNVTGYQREKIKTSVDGCGVPVHRLPLYHLALAFGRLATPEKWIEGTPARKGALQLISDAMVAEPEMVAGTKRFDTDLMKAFEGRIVAKVGAEGVYCFGDRETGIGVAIKVEDGNERATNVAAMEVIHQLGIGESSILQQLSSYHHAPVLNARNEKIGVIKPNFELTMI
ncbi:asparaginase [Aquibacillus halophilus]|uniref:Asparaginase n=1 Tax=Aquibacillus halophilus TaxID=930132 RepID=A0A6A8DEY9_9BACI|nr:asparaginase [Aquibacillus halophilus]MRH44278.1 asparaginase [Aquibacillus halophilus]